MGVVAVVVDAVRVRGDGQVVRVIAVRVDLVRVSRVRATGGYVMPRVCPIDAGNRIANIAEGASEGQ